VKTLDILNDAPYGSERTYNGLRLAGALARRPGNEVHVFLIGDAVAGAAKGQKDAAGLLQRRIDAKGHRPSSSRYRCGSCMDARGMTEETLVDGSHRISMDELTDWTDGLTKSSSSKNVPILVCR